MNPNIYNMQNYILKPMGKTMDVMGIQNTRTARKEYENFIMHTTSKNCQMIR